MAINQNLSDLLTDADYAAIETRLIAHTPLFPKGIPMSAHKFNTKNKTHLASQLRRDADRTNPPWKPWAHIPLAGPMASLSLNELPDRYRTRFLLLRLADWCGGCYIEKDPLAEWWPVMTIMRGYLRDHANIFASKLAYKNVADAMELYKIEKRRHSFGISWFRENYMTDSFSLAAMGKAYGASPKRFHKGAVTGRWTSSDAKSMGYNMAGDACLYHQQYRDEYGTLRCMTYSYQDGVLLIHKDRALSLAGYHGAKVICDDIVAKDGKVTGNVTAWFPEVEEKPNKQLDATYAMNQMVRIKVSDLNVDDHGDISMDLDTLHDYAEDNPL